MGSCTGPSPLGREEVKLGIIGTKSSHDALWELLRSRSPGKVLDVPTGQGPLARFLVDLGWEVHCADIDPGLFRLRGVPFSQVDLNRALPYDSESFDAIVCANGLHRLYNPGGAIREFSRILRPGGTLFLNLNNYSSIKARLRFLLWGSMNHVLNEGTVQQTISAPEAHVRQCLLLPQVATALAEAGLDITTIRPSPLRGAHSVLLAPIGWSIRALSSLVSEDTRRRAHLRHANSAGVLSRSDYMVLEVRKPAEAAGCAQRP